MGLGRLRTVRPSASTRVGLIVGQWGWDAYELCALPTTRSEADAPALQEQMSAEVLVFGTRGGTKRSCAGSIWCLDCYRRSVVSESVWLCILMFS
ncbi:LOW QUALITY PROTEIN: uncharacterized protein EMH_0095760 [Eimeria mitis]|uniref:Uncharacterized protein n=1 Tax=Eimeria mitis TaxID=44415 RepID=U6KIX9_9EIME|nr:LOW QUALITY PROTEIN: uncharacterized protein EMH_0095760 [Eimeria mitis]CDJ36771.1 hypothetical protein EMH_0095760 [Eimeria mitis]